MAKGAPFHHTWSKVDRKYNTGGLVSVEALDRENATSVSASRVSRKLSVRTSFGRKPPNLTILSNKSGLDHCLTPTSIILNEETISSPSSLTQSGLSSTVSTTSPSTTFTPVSPLDKPLPKRPTSPLLPPVAELPGYTPSPKEAAIFPPPRNPLREMGQLAEYGRAAHMEGFDIKRPRTTTGISSMEARRHRRIQSENSTIMRDPRDVSPTPLPLFANGRPIIRPDCDPIYDMLEVERAVQPAPRPAPALSVTKKRTASGSFPRKPLVPAKNSPPMIDRAIKKQTSADAPERDVELDAVRIERDYLSSSLKEAQGKIETALGQLSKSQINERMLKAQVDGLERRLEDANAQRLDAFEQNTFLEEKLHQLLSKDKHSPAERFPINSDAIKLREAGERIKDLEIQVQAAKQQGGLHSVIAAHNGQIDQFQKAVKEKDKNIQGLEQQNSNLRFHLENLQQRLQSTLKTNEALRAAEVAQRGLVEAQQASAGGMANLQAKAAEHEAQVRKVEAEKDQIAALLHAEIRRQATVENKFEHPATLALSSMGETDKMIAETKARVGSLTSKNEMYSVHNPSRSPQDKISQMEKEIEYHVKDIVLYKLDVKGYKKDLRRANAKVKKLVEAEATRQTLSPTAAPSPSPSYASTATSSGVGSAHPTTPSPGPYTALNRTAYPFSPEPLARPEQQPPFPTATVPKLSVRSTTPTTPRRPKRATTPPPASFQKFASSTPTTPTTPTAPQSTVQNFSQPMNRRRALTGPARSFSNSDVPQVKTRGATSVPQSPMWSQSQSQPHHNREVSEPLPVNHIVHQLQVVEGSGRVRADTVGEQVQVYELGQKSPLEERERQLNAATTAASRNSAQGWPDVPGGGLPPMQTWKGSDPRVINA